MLLGPEVTSPAAEQTLLGSDNRRTWSFRGCLAGPRQRNRDLLPAVCLLLVACVAACRSVDVAENTPSPPLAPEPVIEAPRVSGDLPYSTGVTLGGQVYVKVPLEPVPKPTGFDPALSINYLRGGERHWVVEAVPRFHLGYGWQFVGPGAIRRCVKNRDDTDRLSLTDSDGLCFIQGEPLELISGTHLRAGAEYRTLRESFARVSLKQERGRLWFEVVHPNETIQEYGRTSDSHLAFDDEVGTGTPFLWHVNRQVDTSGNEATYSYHEDSGSGVRYLERIEFGDYEIRFLYTERGDAEWREVGTRKTVERLLLHTIQARRGGKRVREYRLVSETTDQGWRRLREIQRCTYDESGESRSCLAPLRIGWAEPSATLLGVENYVSSVTSPTGRRTRFEFDAIHETAPSDVLFDERPFGESLVPADTRPLLPGDDGVVRTVVAAMEKDTPSGETERTTYAYQGRGHVSTRNWGFLGFYATRMTDEASGTVTYSQYRLDFPHFAEKSAEYRYDGRFGPDVQVLAKREMRYAAHVVDYGNATTVWPYLESGTVFFYSGGVLEAVMQSRSAPTFEDVMPKEMTVMSELGQDVETSGGGAFWGDVPIHALTDVQRQEERTIDLMK